MMEMEGIPPTVTSGEDGQQQRCLVCQIAVPSAEITGEGSDDKAFMGDLAQLLFNKEDLPGFQRDFCGAQSPAIFFCGECKSGLTDVKGFTKGLILIEERVKEAFEKLMKEVNDLKVAAEWTEAFLKRISDPKRAEAKVTVKNEAAGRFRKGIEKGNKRVSLLLDSIKGGKLVLEGFKLKYISNELDPEVVAKVHNEIVEPTETSGDSSGIAIRKEPKVVLTRLPPESIRLAGISLSQAMPFLNGGAATAQTNEEELGHGISNATKSSGQKNQSENASIEDTETSEDEASSISSPGSTPPHGSSASGSTAAESVSKSKVGQRRSNQKGKSTMYFQRSHMFHCKRCSKTTKSAPGIIYHYKSVHLKKRYKCNICNAKSFTTLFYLNEHKKTCRQNLEKFKKKEKDPRFKFVCEECGKRFDKNKSLCNHRFFVHRNVGRYPCDLCDKKFPLASKLRIHKNSVHFRKYFCRFCKKISHSRSINVSHERNCAKTKRN